MNFIFDIGNVLAEYKPVDYLETLFSDDSIVRKMNNTIFKSRQWVLMDLGELSHKDAMEIFCESEPEFESAIRKTFSNINDVLPPISETIELLPKIKSLGHNLFYLSNMHKEFSIYLLENYDYFDLFDGGVFSSDVHLIKPSPEIYRLLLNEYSLDPKDCLFFDDVEENVTAAEKEGIKGVLFTTAECVLRYI